MSVAPRVGAWIEITQSCHGFAPENVAPRVGAWIEISCSSSDICMKPVAPRVGEWIEIFIYYLYFGLQQSLPVWERGLK